MASSSSSSKDPEPCSICLEPLKQQAYLDRCFHSFCYPCIVYWSQVLGKKNSQPLSSLKCPLCKTENDSIIHGFNGEYFQQHYVSQGKPKSFLSSAHDFRFHWYNNSNVKLVTNKRSDVLLYWKRRKYLQRNIWLQSWLRREIQVLVQEEDVDIILHHIHGVIETFVRRQQWKGTKDVTPEEKNKEFRELLSGAAMPFLLGRTERFVDEVELFLVLGLNIEAYDEVCMLSLEGVSTSGE